MILTEEEARTKRCQETPRKESADGYLRGQYCIASACMAWRWQNRTASHEPDTGYCGKAGKP